MSSQSGQKVLRVGLIQNGRILEERLMRSSQPVTIGHGLKKNTLVVPASSLPKTYTIFAVSQGAYVLQFTDKMSGRVSVGDGVQSLEDLIKQGKAKKSSDGYAIPLSPNARGKVVIGEVTVLFQFVSAPPPRPKPVLPASMRGGWVKGVEPALALIIALSAIFQIGFVVWLESQDWPQPLDVDYQFPDRMVQVLIDEEPDEPPEIEPTEITEDGEGEVVVEEDKPAPSAKSDDTPEELAAEKARERTMKAVEDRTILRTLGAKGGEGGTLVDTLLHGAGNISAEEAFAGSTGVVLGEAGAERSGVRRTGGPDGDGVGASAGIGDMKGLEGAKNANVDTGKVQERQVKAKAIRIQDPQDMAGGSLDQASITGAIRRRQSAIQNCFERQLRRDHQAGGRIVINFTITARGPRGAVSQAKAVVDDVGGGVGACVAKEIMNLRPLPAPDGGDVIINMPFVFQAQ